MARNIGQIRNRVTKGETVSSAEALRLSGSDFKGVSRAELAKVVSTLASSANKRLKRLENAGQPITDTISKFSVAGKSRNELMKEFRRVKNFMNAENQSLSGQAKIARKALEGIAQIQTGKTKGKDYKKAYNDYKKVLGTSTAEGSPYYNFWTSYDRLKDTNKYIANKQYKYRVLSEQIKIMKQNPGISLDDLHVRMQSIVDKTYTEVQTKIAEDTPQDAFTFTLK